MSMFNNLIQNPSPSAPKGIIYGQRGEADQVGQTSGFGSTKRWSRRLAMPEGMRLQRAQARKGLRLGEQNHIGHTPPIWAEIPTAYAAIRMKLDAKDVKITNKIISRMLNRNKFVPFVHSLNS